MTTYEKKKPIINNANKSKWGLGLAIIPLVGLMVFFPRIVTTFIKYGH